MATQSSGFGAGRNNAERKAVSGSDTGGNNGDTAARPNVVSNINSNLMVQDKATKRWIPLQFDATGGTGITVTLSGGAFRDAEGLPANVASAAAYGTSAFAARRDHVHTIAAATVTAAMLASVTGSGAVVLATSPTLVTPALGTPSSGSLGSCTNIPVANATGVLATLNGGTGAALTPAIGDILYATSGTTMARLADVAAGSYLRSGGVTTAPLWSTLTLPNSAGIGDILYATGSNTIGNLVNATLNNVLICNGAGTTPQWGTISLSSSASVSGTLPIANGGTNSSTALAGGRPVCSNATKIVESTGYTRITGAGTTVAAGDNEGVFDCDATSGAFTITLPAATVGLGFKVTIRKTDSSANAVTIGLNGTDGIDGNTTANKLNGQWSHLILRSTGAAGSGNGQGWIVEGAHDYIQPATPAFTNVTATVTTQDVASQALTPGIWMVSGIVTLQLNGATCTAMAGGINTAATTLGSEGTNYAQTAVATAATDAHVTLPPRRIIVTSATTAYLNTICTFSAGNPKVSGVLICERVN